MADKDMELKTALFTVVGVACAMFALNVGLWYAARNLAWWTYALSAAGGTLGLATVKAVWQVWRKERRARQARRIYS